uniref:Neuronal-specific septin-3-like n=2 Tax=Oryzias melastigma TaxID=30732 RepID=A0A3B3B9D2_ORYME
MSETPNEHLAGILSDFEALKRSFDDEVEEDTPYISTASPVSPPISSSSCNYFLHHDKAREGKGGGGHSTPFSFNNTMTPPPHSQIHMGYSPSSVLKTCSVRGSFSFNRGTTAWSVIQNNGSSVTRAASFQSRPNPTICSQESKRASDNDGLHSSAFNLEYSCGGGPVNRPLFSQCPPSQRESHGPQHPQQHLESNKLKLSFHGTVIKSDPQGGILDGQEHLDKNFGLVSFQDFQNPNDGVGLLGSQRDVNGKKYVDDSANWNGQLCNASALGEDSFKKAGQHVTQVLKSSLSKPKEIPRLNKFPLDLDKLVSSKPTASPTTESESMSLSTSASPPQRPCSLQNRPHDSSTATSPSASLSSLDSSFYRQNSSFRCPLSLSSQSSPNSPVPEMRGSTVPLFSSHSFQMDIPSAFQAATSLHSPSSPSVTSSLGVTGSLEDDGEEETDSVDLILQRIASFSWPVITDGEVKTQKPVQSNGELPSQFWGSTGSKHTVTYPWKEGKANCRGTTAECETDPFTSMEDRGERDAGIMTENTKEESKVEETLQPAAAETADRLEADAETEKNQRQEDTEQMEADLKVQLCESLTDLQTGFIQGADLFGYVGIESVLDQMRRKTIKAGFEFNIMVVGQSGLGKSTLVNTLFKSKVSRKSCTANYEEKISKTVRLHAVSHVIEEKGVKMKLTVIDTPGFGDQINNQNCWEPIEKYVNEQYEKYLREELNVNRKRRIPDSRVHCCIYFLPASGHRLRPIDVEFMQRLGKIVSIVPVIAKADTLTVEERQEFKERIREDLEANSIRVYPQRELDEDPEDRLLNDRIRDSIPFAVVGTDKEHQVNGHKVLGRKTKWGIIEVENVAHCEFANLRDLLIRSHLQDLKDVAHNVHYETYRVRRLNESNMNLSDLVLSSWPLQNQTDKCETESQL